MGRRILTALEKFKNLFFNPQFLLRRLILGISTCSGIYKESQFPSSCGGVGCSFQYRLKKRDFPCTTYKAKTKLLQFNNCYVYLLTQMVFKSKKMKKKIDWFHLRAVSIKHQSINRHSAYLTCQHFTVNSAMT